jgi:hypothetical protein
VHQHLQPTPDEMHALAAFYGAKASASGGGAAASR